MPRQSGDRQKRGHFLRLDPNPHARGHNALCHPSGFTTKPHNRTYSKVFNSKALNSKALNSKAVRMDATLWSPR